MSSVSFKNINKELEDGGALKDFTLSIDNGEIIALTGHKGCGKADLLRMLEGAAHSFEGDVMIGSHRISSVMKRENAASLATEMPLFGTPRMEIRRKLNRMHMQPVDQRIDEAFEKLGKKELADTRWYAMDREQRLIAGMARAMAIEAEVVLFNEPFARIDSRTSDRMRRSILNFSRIYPTTIIYTVQKQSDALALATKIVLLDGGVIHQYDTPQNIYDYPADETVAAYFGHRLINLVDAQVISGENGLMIKRGSLCLPLPAGRFADAAQLVGTTVKVGIRPENIRYEQSFISMSPDTVFSAVVDFIEPAGSESYLHVNIDGFEGELVARVDSRCAAFAGDKISLAVDVNHIHIFDGSGKSIIKRK